MPDGRWGIYRVIDRGKMRWQAVVYTRTYCFGSTRGLTCFMLLVDFMSDRTLRKHLTKKLTLAVLAVSFISLQGAMGQVPQDTVSLDRATIIKAARQVMQDARYCALVTIGENGYPQSRIVDPFPPEEDMAVWIGTNPVTRKIAQIRKDPRVTLFYFDTASLSYVTLIGKAELINDPKEKSKHWKEEWAPLYKNGSRGDDYMLIRVEPLRTEIVSYTRGMLNDAVTWAPVAVDFR